jgi:hypothetical protein
MRPSCKALTVLTVLEITSSRFNTTKRDVCVDWAVVQLARSLTLANQSRGRAVEH